MKKTYYLAACIAIIFLVILFRACSKSSTPVNDSNTKMSTGKMNLNPTFSVNDIKAKIDINNPKIIFKNEFNVDIIIQNNGSSIVNIDVSPDEVISPPTETSGGQYRQKGSHCTLSVTQDQDKNGRFDFFSTSLSKIQPPEKSMTYFSILPGKTHTITFTLNPWGPTYGSLPSNAIPGPAEIHGNLQLIINERLYNITLDSFKLDSITE